MRTNTRERSPVTLSWRVGAACAGPEDRDALSGTGALVPAEEPAEPEPASVAACDCALDVRAPDGADGLVASALRNANTATPMRTSSSTTAPTAIT